jgi:hypothetical protein
MQMRSWAVWCFTVIGLCALANPAWAAPKKKKSKAQTAETTEPAEVESAPAAISDDSKDMDALMDDSTKNKPPSVKKQQLAEPDGDKPLYNDDSNAASAWERPPAEAEKPKKKKKTERGEVVSAPAGDGNNMNIGVLAGYGLGLGSGLTSLNPYGLGVGLVGEYELENHLVLGIGGEYFLGERDPNATNNNGVRIPANANYILGHVNVGYSLWIGNNLILRPTIWVGAAIGFVTKTPPHLTGLVVTALLGPGLTLHYLLGPAGWYLGGEIRVSIPVGQANSTKTGMPLFFTFGKRF